MRFLVLVLVLSIAVLVLERTQKTDPIFDYERLDIYRLAIEYEYRFTEYEYRFTEYDSGQVRT